MVSNSAKITPLESLLVITIWLVAPFSPVGGSDIIKFIDISAYMRSGIGSGFSKLSFVSRQIVVLLQISQLRVNFRTLLAAPGQKNLFAIIAYVAFFPGWPVI